MKFTTNQTIVVCCIGIILLSPIISYNFLASGQVGIEQAYAQLDNVYERRVDVLTSGAQVLKSYAGTQKDIVDSYVASVNELKQAHTTQDREIADQKITDSLGVLLSVNRIPEGLNPQAWSDFTVEIEGANNRVSVERRNLIKRIANYNKLTHIFPVNMFAQLFGFDAAEQYQTAAANRVNPSIGDLLG